MRLPRPVPPCTRTSKRTEVHYPSMTTPHMALSGHSDGDPHGGQKIVSGIRIDVASDGRIGVLAMAAQMARPLRICGHLLRRRSSWTGQGFCAWYPNQYGNATQL